MTEHRAEFVALAQQPGANRRALCRHVGIAPMTGDKWLRCYAAEGPAGLQDRSPAAAPQSGADRSGHRAGRAGAARAAPHLRRPQAVRAAGPPGRPAAAGSLANQALLPRPRLPAALELGRAAGALGVNVAHSGTVIGLLFDAGAERITWAAHSARQRLPEIVAIHDCRIIGGGAAVYRGRRRMVAPTA